METNVKFVIGTVSDDLELKEDLKLIRASLLYADEIELIGIAEYALMHYLPKGIVKAHDINEIFNVFMPFIKAVNTEDAKQILRDFETIKRDMALIQPIYQNKRRRSRQEILAQVKLDKIQNQAKEELLSAINPFLKADGPSEINRIREKGYIKVYDYKKDNFTLDDLAGSYIGNLLQVAYDETAFPLFDKITADVADSIIKRKKLSVTDIKPEVIRHAGVATNIIMTLPALEKAGIDELIDLKKDLSIPLINFRKAIYQFSEEIESMPWEKDFEYDCLKLYSTEVLPKIEEINELACETSVLRNMGKQVLQDEEIRKKLGFVAGGIATTITTTSNLEGVVGVLEKLLHQSAGIGVTAAVAMTFLQSANMYINAREKTNEAKKNIKNNMMYFYYKLLQS